MIKSQWQNWINLILGFGIFSMPWSQGHPLAINNALIINYNFWLVGLVVTLSSALALKDLKPWEEWVNMILGVWLMLSPWALGYMNESSLMLNSFILGLSVAVLSAMALPVAQGLNRR